MNINLDSAVKFFYRTSSFDDIYCEAVVNAIDADATEISIQISIESFKKAKSLQIAIEDNGCGFTKENFEKFSILLNTDKNDHKGVGRLVYLAYFKKIDFSSYFNNGWERHFIYDQDFNGEDWGANKSETLHNNGTKLIFSGFKNQQLNKHGNVQPSEIKSMLIDKFLPMFYAMKQKGRVLTIHISNSISATKEEKMLSEESVTLTLNDLPKFKEKDIVLPFRDLFSQISATIFYAITPTPGKKGDINCSICIDGRTMNYEIAPADVVPSGHRAQFIIQSDALKCEANAARQQIIFPESIDEESFKKHIKREISILLNQELPDIVKKNEKSYHDFEKKYPHLYGLYNSEYSVGLTSAKSIMEGAKDALFKKQQHILECEHLSERDFADAMEIASRSLTEYVIYRARIIEKLKEADKQESERDIHNIISKRNLTYTDSCSTDDIYNNNVWLLDDKFMSYDVTLSDERLKKLIAKIEPEEAKNAFDEQNKKPDISLIFSGDPETCEQVDVVIVELKKYGDSIKEEEYVITQLKQRARKLVDYYGGRIGRMWFFGIAELDEEFKLSLEEKRYQKLFSKGEVFYHQEEVISTATRKRYPIDVFLTNYETIVLDAEARNNAFLNILKRRIRDFSHHQR